MMPTGRRFIWILSMAAFLVVTSGCSTTNLKRIEEELARDGTGLHKEGGQAVEGYVLHDGTRAAFKGRARLADQDSLAFWKEDNSGEVGNQGTKKNIKVYGPVFALKAVRALDIKETSVSGTPWLVAGIVAGIVIIAVVAYQKYLERLNQEIWSAFY